MTHKIHRVAAFETTGAFSLRIKFEDGLSREIDFSEVLAGPLLGPLEDIQLFDQVKLDPEVHTLVWPNGADFDPETLYHWDRYFDPLRERAQKIHKRREEIYQSGLQGMRDIASGKLTFTSDIDELMRSLDDD